MTTSLGSDAPRLARPAAPAAVGLPAGPVAPRRGAAPRGAGRARRRLGRLRRAPGAGPGRRPRRRRSSRALARALQLHPRERDHLYRLAGLRPPGDGISAITSRPACSACSPGSATRGRGLRRGLAADVVEPRLGGAARRPVDARAGRAQSRPRAVPGRRAAAGSRGLAGRSGDGRHGSGDRRRPARGARRATRTTAAVGLIRAPSTATRTSPGCGPPGAVGVTPRTTRRSSTRPSARSPSTATSSPSPAATSGSSSTPWPRVPPTRRSWSSSAPPLERDHRDAGSVRLPR